MFQQFYIPSVGVWVHPRAIQNVVRKVSAIIWNWTCHFFTETPQFKQLMLQKLPTAFNEISKECYFTINLASSYAKKS